jgi:tRNA threonylcarbamoyladenosine biosynthesis protein TsaB
MNILAIDTASRSCSVAVVADGDVRAEINDGSGRTHSRHLMSMVDRAIAMSVGVITAIDIVAVTKGPGSFTGLRIGISAAKGLAEAVDRPLVGVSSLKALAWQAYFGDGIIVPMLDARRSEVYTACYRREANTLTQISEEQALSPEAAVDSLREPCLLIGDGAVAYAEPLSEILGERMLMALPFQHPIKASTVAFLAGRSMDGRTDERTSLAPHYIRQSYVDDGRHKAG